MIEHIGVTLDHIELMLDHIELMLDRIAVMLKLNGNMIELNGNMIGHEPRLQTHIQRFQPGKCDLIVFARNTLVALNSRPSRIDQIPVPWWHWLDGMMEGDRLRPWAGHRGNFWASASADGEGYSNGKKLLSHAEL
jgi:hypothetical protein